MALVVNLGFRTAEGWSFLLAGRPDLSIINREGLVAMDGYSTAIEYKGTTLIVQTQDKGPAFNYVESLIYLAGRLINSKKAYYTSHLSQKNLPEIIQQLVEDLHTEVLDEIVEGKYDKFIE